METIEIKFGHENFQNYRRLAYKWWYALAEFVDNSSQSEIDNRVALQKDYGEKNDFFKVVITRDEDFLRIWDNAMGMSREDLEAAFVVGRPPANPKGRSRYGMGLKTAACWIGNRWTIVTTKMGDPNEYTVEIDVNKIASGNLSPELKVRETDVDDHFTRIEIKNHNRKLQGRTVRKVKDYLTSIYRKDAIEGTMHLTFDDTVLQWQPFSDDDFLSPATGGNPYRRDFIFEIESIAGKKVVEGWAGVLKKGSRSKAGFSIFHRNRLIKGYPDSWRPEDIYGEGGRNDLVNQRLVGEVNLEDFDVSHTKDDINWHGDEEYDLGKSLAEELATYITAARKARKGAITGGGPRDIDVSVAVQSLEEDLVTQEFLERLTLEEQEPLPEKSTLEMMTHNVVQTAAATDPVINVLVGDMAIRIFLNDTSSSFDPYFSYEALDKSLDVVVNKNHPAWQNLHGENSIFYYLQHCAYDAIAEFRASLRKRLDAAAVKMLKDSYMRVRFETDQLGGEESSDEG